MTVTEILDSIKELRKQKKFSQRDIAEKLEISKSQYSFYEKGKSKMSLTTFFKILSILEIEVVDFFKEPVNEITEDDVKKLKEIVDLFKAKLKVKI